MALNYRVNLHHLAVFHAVEETGSVTLGAKQIQISQPVASKQLRELEHSLREPIFDRTSHGLRLAAAGELLARHAGKIFTLESEAARAIADLNVLGRGKLTRGVRTHSDFYLLPAIVAEFHRCHQGIHICVAVRNTELVYQEVLNYCVDLGLTEGFFDHGGLTSEVFAEDELIVVAAPGRPRAQKRRLRARHLTGVGFVLREPGSKMRAIQERALASYNVFFKELMTLGSTEAIKRVVASGVGLSILSKLCVRAELAAGTLVAIALADRADTSAAAHCPGTGSLRQLVCSHISGCPRR